MKDEDERKTGKKEAKGRQGREDERRRQRRLSKLLNLIIKSVNRRDSGE